MAEKLIDITTGDISITAKLNDSPTAVSIWEALPVEGRVNRWGEEIYFKIPVSAEQEKDARAEVNVGELGYWPVGEAFCIFFGPTPMSGGDKPVAASPVNIVGEVEGDSTVLTVVPDGAAIRLSRLE